MTSVLIVDSDPIALELVQRAFHERESVTCIALDASEANHRIVDECHDCDGMITDIDLGGPMNGWGVARMAREVNPRIAIGYMSAAGHSDWAAYGVPNSVLINKTIGATEIAAAFLDFCESGRRGVGHIGETTESIVLFGGDPIASGGSPTQATDSFATVDWSTTPLGPTDSWDGTLRSWVRFMLTSNEPTLMLWGAERIVLFNTPFGALFGNVFKHSLGTAFSPPHWKDWDECSALMNQAMGGKSGARTALRLAQQPGATTHDRFFDLSCAPIQDPAGTTISTICLFTDTTEAIWAAESVRRERDGLHALLTQVPGFIAFLVGPDHRYAFANAAYLQLVERASLIGERVIDAFPEVIEQGFIQILDRVYLTGEPFIAKGVTAVFRRPDGSLKHTFIDLNYYAIRAPGGKITGIFVAGEDLTEQHRAQERIGVLQNELIHISRVNAMGMMASTIAHELNQPLTAIHNYMTVARMVMERDAAQSSAIEPLQEAADAALRAGDIIRNLRSMTTRREVLRAPVLLEESVRETVGLASLGQSNMRVTFAVPGTITALGDKILIQQIVFNLVRNAVEAADGEDVDVTITAIDKGPVVELCVSDTGPGIDKMLLPSVFDSFVTTKADGTGIGLSICKAIVEAHGGVITARNGAERGAIFCFTLPQLP